MLSAGADPGAPDTSFLDMRTPLHKAADQGHREVSIALMGTGADPNTHDASGASPLDVVMTSATRGMYTSSARSSKGSEGRGEHSPTSNLAVALGSNLGAGRDWGGVQIALEQHGGRRSRACSSSVAVNVECAEGDAVQVRSECSLGYSKALSGASGKLVIGERTASGGTIDTPQMLASDSVQRSEPTDYVSEGGTFVDQGRNLGSKEAIPEVLMARVGQEICKASGNNDGVHSISTLPAQQQEYSHGIDITRVTTHTKGNQGSRISAEGTGVPCGECRAPVVTMVRSSCCRGLLCKSCARSMRIRREVCRQCRDSSNRG